MIRQSNGNDEPEPADEEEAEDETDDYDENGEDDEEWEDEEFADCGMQEPSLMPGATTLTVYSGMDEYFHQFFVEYVN